MRRNPNSSRSNQFFKRNCLNFDQTKDVVVKLLNEYKIYNYEIKKISNDLKTRKAFEDIMGLYVYKEDGTAYITYCNPQYIELKLFTSNDNFSESINFTENSCWRNCIAFIKNFLVTEEQTSNEEIRKSVTN